MHNRDRTPFGAAAFVALATLAFVSSAPTTSAHSEAEHLFVNLHDNLTVTINYVSDNPDLHLVPGETYEVQVLNQGSSLQHDFHIDGLDVHTELLAPGESVTFDLTIPDDVRGPLSYYCKPHQNAMRGAVLFGSDDDAGAPGAGYAVTVALLAGVAIAAHRHRTRA